jgi:flagellar M-ring protein FliF
MMRAAVTVLSTDGVLLSSGDDQADEAPAAMLALEKTVSREIVDNVRKTLAPFLGLPNFQVSVAAKLNTDKRQTNETIYDPESRVERSVRVIKQNQLSQNSSSSSPTTVQRNLPQENAVGNDGKQSNEESKKQEELTNYEVSSKSVATVSGGYAIERISVAVLVNKASLLSPNAGKLPPEGIEQRISELEQLVVSSSGVRKERGDTIKVMAVDFAEAGQELAPHPVPGVGELLLRQTGTVVNAVTILAVALLLIWFGLRPATKAILSLPGGGNVELAEMADHVSIPEIGPNAGDSDRIANWPAAGEGNLIEDLTNRSKRTPQKRLAQIIEYDEAQAAAILKQWLHQGESR